MKGGKTRWRKLLYIKQDYPDNHVDTSFLDEMKKNVNTTTFTYWNVSANSGSISQQLCSIFIYISVFYRLYHEIWRVQQTFIWLFGGCCIGYGVWLRFTDGSGKDVFHALRSSVLICMILLGLSPIMRTLTKDISPDTIWALTAGMFLFNLAFHNYGLQTTAFIEFPNSLSINAAIFASVLLASLPPPSSRNDMILTDFYVFALILFAMIVFGLFPTFRRSIKARSFKLDIAMTVGLNLMAILLYVDISMTVVYIITGVLGFIGFIGPWILVLTQHYKAEITGPWDEARIKK